MNIKIVKVAKVFRYRFFTTELKKVYGRVSEHSSFGSPHCIFAGKIQVQYDNDYIKKC
jgi:hypothetical protein